MNYHALDEVLSYIEDGVIGEEFIMTDMLNSIDIFNESIELITEGDSFIEKVKNAIKKAINAIVKFFKNIWAKFKTWFTETMAKAKVAIGKKLIDLKAATDKDFKDFLYNNKVYEMPVDFYKTIDVLLSAYASTKDTIKNPMEYVTGNLSHKKVAAVEAAELYVKFINDATRAEADLDKRVKELEDSKKELSEVIKKLEKISKMSKEESKAAFDKLMTGKDPIVIGDPQAGVTNPEDAKLDLAINKDELKKVNNCLKVSTVVIEVTVKELNKANAAYDAMEEMMAKKIKGESK